MATMGCLVLFVFLVALPAVQTQVDFPCVTDKDCPPASHCRPRGCDGYVCVCNAGFMPDFDQMSCVKALRVGEACGEIHRCLSVMAECVAKGAKENSNGTSAVKRCTCGKNYRTVEEHRTCTFDGKKIMGENCTHRSECADAYAECANGACSCEPGHRLKTDAEFWANPADGRFCVRDEYRLDKCENETVLPPPLYVHIEAGDPCTGQNQCVENAVCTATISGVCKCGDKFYNDQGRCVPRKKAGSACFGTGECVGYAECSSTMGGTCDCIPGYCEIHGKCEPCQDTNSTCTGTGQCGEHAECSSDGKCVCRPGFYQNNRVCVPDIEAGDPCTGQNQCVENAVCTATISGVCKCGDKFYNDQGRCVPRKKAGSACLGTGECVGYAECSSTMGGTCDCIPGYCEIHGKCEPCQDTNSTCTGAGQCGEYAECSSDGKCVCRPGFYQNNGVCVPVCLDSCYTISDDSLNFDDARAACKAAGAKLAEIETLEENNFLKLFAKPEGNAAYWLGGTDRKKEGTFLWIGNGRPFDFTDWAPGQEDAWGDKDCVELRMNLPAESWWEYNRCDAINRYVCERGRQA